ncbi:MAG: hypothetical protein DRG83_11470 [Deltaproteobacteria bacterium]|nr:MAG: hypothetical protein DRG83_11470 [Deltaproteobacteria bacterium]
MPNILLCNILMMRQNVYLKNSFVERGSDKMPKVPQVTVIGHIIIETIIFPNGNVVTPVLGSPAAYSSVALAKLGTQVGLCTKVGKDMPQELLKPFIDTSVNIDGLIVEGDHSTTNKLIYQHLESKRVEYIHKAPDITVKDIPEHFREAQLFYICPMDFEVPSEVIEELAKTGKPVFVDLGGYGGATSSQHQLGDEVLLEQLKPILRSATLVKASLEDSQLILGSSNTKNSMFLDEAIFAKKFLDMGAEKVIITLGSRGVLYSDSYNNKYYPSFPCNAFDTTGAGDTFCAGTIHEYLKTQNLEKAILFGEAVACLVIRKTGGVKAERMPTEAEVRKFLQVITQNT